MIFSKFGRVLVVDFEESGPFPSRKILEQAPHSYSNRPFVNSFKRRLDSAWEELFSKVPCSGCLVNIFVSNFKKMHE